jgi:hypothetical protein
MTEAKKKQKESLISPYIPLYPGPKNAEALRLRAVISGYDEPVHLAYRVHSLGRPRLASSVFFSGYGLREADVPLFVVCYLF